MKRGPMLNSAPFGSPVLATTAWQDRERAHLERVHEWTVPYRERRSRHEAHPVYDFLFQYYRYSTGKLEAWHPRFGEALSDSEQARTRFAPPTYRAAEGLIRHDVSALTHVDRERQRGVVDLLRITERQSANLGCFGVHEWAMVYGGHEVRHGRTTPLRLPQSEVDAFVDDRPVVCSHFDAYRFFAPRAKPLNRLDLEWETRNEVEQPGCIHANMDLYRWAYEAMPWVGSDLLWLTFELAVDLRVLDMQASPYDLTGLGFGPVRVETDEGRAEYRTRQRALSERARVLRAQLIEALVVLLGESHLSSA